MLPFAVSTAAACFWLLSLLAGGPVHAHVYNVLAGTTRLVPVGARRIDGLGPRRRGGGRRRRRRRLDVAGGVDGERARQNGDDRRRLLAVGERRLLGARRALAALLELVDAVADEVLLVGVEFEADAQRQRPRRLARRRHEVHLHARHHQVNSALHPSGVAKSSTSFGWLRAGMSPLPGGR